MRHLRAFLHSIAILAPLSPAAAGDLELGRHLSAECTACHQMTGRASGGIPAIIAWPEAAFVAALQAYRDKQRANAAMQLIAGKLSEEEMAALAAYFHRQKAQP